jgi:hypothetical protein
VTTDNLPRRVWVNQPSTLQPLHEIDRTLGLAVYEDAGYSRLYFLSGPVISCRAPNNALSDGWPAHLSDAA